MNDVTPAQPRVFPSYDERDRAIEATYLLSPQILAWMDMQDRPENTAAAVVQNVTTLAQAYITERGTANFAVRWVDWQVRHFGRELEPVAARALLFEVRKLIPVDEGGTLRRVHKLFRDEREQRQWQVAARKVVESTEGFADLPFEQQLGLIAARAGHQQVKPDKRKAAKPMRVLRPMTDEQFDERIQKLREQAAVDATPVVQVQEEGESWWNK